MDRDKKNVMNSDEVGELLEANMRELSLRPPILDEDTARYTMMYINDPQTLLSLCSVNRIFANICRDESFWEQKVNLIATKNKISAYTIADNFKYSWILLNKDRNEHFMIEVHINVYYEDVDGRVAFGEASETYHNIDHIDRQVLEYASDVLLKCLADYNVEKNVNYGNMIFISYMKEDKIYFHFGNKVGGGITNIDDAQKDHLYDFFTYVLYECIYALDASDAVFYKITINEPYYSNQLAAYSPNGALIDVNELKTIRKRDENWGFLIEIHKTIAFGDIESMEYIHNLEEFAYNHDLVQ